VPKPILRHCSFPHLTRSPRSSLTTPHTIRIYSLRVPRPHPCTTTQTRLVFSSSRHLAFPTSLYHQLPTTSLSPSLPYFEQGSGSPAAPITRENTCFPPLCLSATTILTPRVATQDQISRFRLHALAALGNNLAATRLGIVRGFRNTRRGW
jgi:hypothetical protein